MTQNDLTHQSIKSDDVMNGERSQNKLHCERLSKKGEVPEGDWLNYTVKLTVTYVYFNIMRALCRVYFGGPINVGPRI